MLTRWVGGLAGLMVVAGALGGCGGDPDPLTEALGHVRDTAKTRATVEFGDVAAVKKANGGSLTGTGRYGHLYGYGMGNLAQTPAARVKQALGIDPGQVQQAITAGAPPDSAWRMTGSFDADAVTGKLKALGGRQDGDDLRLRADKQVNLSDTLGKRLPGVVNGMNVVRVTDDAIVHGSSAAAVAALDADDGTLADNERFHAVASCLDSPLAALLSGNGFRGAGANAGFTAGVGVRGTDGQAPTEVLCRTARSDQEADQVRQRMEQAIRGTTASTRRPWRTLLTGAEVETLTDGDVPVVRLTAQRAGSGEAGVLIKAATNRDLAALL